MGKNNAEGKSTEVKAASTKAGPKAARKPRGEGAQVSLSIPANLWKVLHATSKLQGTRISVLLAQSLEVIISNAGTTVEEVDRFIKGTTKAPAPKDAKSPVLDRLFGGTQAS